MPADLTLPGTIPGLLRRGSPVVIHLREPDGHLRGVLLHTDTPRLWVVVRQGITSADVQSWSRSSLALDLTDPTGCAHAAWWAAEQERSPDYRERMRRLHLLEAATWGRLTDARRRALRDLCLRLAEVARG